MFNMCCWNFLFFFLINLCYVFSELNRRIVFEIIDLVIVVKMYVCFSEVIVIVEVMNIQSSGWEFMFVVQVLIFGFIMGFQMIMGNIILCGIVQEKLGVDKVYDQVKDFGIFVGKVS